MLVLTAAPVFGDTLSDSALKETATLQGELAKQDALAREEASIRAERERINAAVEDYRRQADKLLADWTRWQEGNHDLYVRVGQHNDRPCTDICYKGTGECEDLCASFRTESNQLLQAASQNSHAYSVIVDEQRRLDNLHSVIARDVHAWADSAVHHYAAVSNNATYITRLRTQLAALKGDIVRCRQTFAHVPDKLDNYCGQPIP